MKCKICGKEANHLFSALVLNKYDVKYYSCKTCGFLYTEEPYWLNEAYTNPINVSDTGIIDRNLHYSKVIAVFLYFFSNKNAKFLDYAGGYGLFTRMMRDIGFDFYWMDPYCNNLFSKGFEHNEEIQQRYELLTAFEVFEHLSNPLEEIEKMLSKSSSIIFSTEIITDTVPPPRNWWYYGFEHGQHISFYSEKSIRYVAKSFGLKSYFLNDLHLLSDRNINEKLVKITLKLSSLGLFSLVKSRMSSRITNDFEVLKR
jgi:hypothetical protein